MDSNACVVYEVSKNSLSCKKLNSYCSGIDETDMDAAISAAFINSDVNHFYFRYPDLVPHKSNHRFACVWCKALCEQEFCSDICALNINLNLALEDMEQSKKIYTLEILF